MVGNLKDLLTDEKDELTSQLARKRNGGKAVSEERG